MGGSFVCGSSAGMGEGVESASEGCCGARREYMDEEGARHFWEEMKEGRKLVVETW